MIRTILTTVTVIIFQCFHLACIQAETFYVSTSGNDNTGNGSLENPWATITGALEDVPDGSLILVKQGTYEGLVQLEGTFSQGVIVRSEIMYKAVLTHDSTVVKCYYGKGISLEGFEIYHDGPGAGALVIHIQDLIGEPGGDDIVSNIKIMNNILHDSYNNDILKINNGCADILVQGNIFYNQCGIDEHIDINSVTNVIVQDNIFFNDFEGSGRINQNDTSSYIVIKDSNGDSDGNIGSEDITVRRNIFFNWQGSTGSNFVLVGEDGNPYFEAQRVHIENNLMLGNSGNIMRSPFGVKGGKDIYFIHNTISGDLPSFAYAMRLNAEGENPANSNIVMACNIWADPTGTMGAKGPWDNNDFSDTPLSETDSFTLKSNLYWNGGVAIPLNASEVVNYTDDDSRVVADPRLNNPAAIVLPRWNPTSGRFMDGSAVIRDIFEKVVKNFGKIPRSSAALNMADPAYALGEDILQNKRLNGLADIGAVEYHSTVIAPQLLLLQ